MVKILNLNLWNYNKWGIRKPKIVDFIRKHKPDIITLQEVRDDVKFNKKGKNQAIALNEELNYPYLIYYPVTDKKKERPEKYKHHCIEGTAIISKYPLTNIIKKQLRKHKDDRYHCGNLIATIKAKKEFDIVVVHFSNSHYFSLLHLLETLKDIKKRKRKPVIIGDFNIIDFSEMHEIIEGEYSSSREKFRYLSYPPAGYTLDYVLLPKGMKFKSFKCLGNGLSDHKALLTEIKL